MIDLKQIQNEINELQKQLNIKKNEYSKAKESNLREKYGDNFGCHNCAYSCCVDSGSSCTYCAQGRCIYCNDFCDQYKPENKLSKYIRKHHHYSEHMIDILNDLFDVSDMMCHPELHQAAWDIMMLRDKKD